MDDKDVKRADTKPGRPPRQAGSKGGSKGGDERTAFDMWLDRGLHRMFDEVAQEPIPDELLKLIDGGRKK